MNHEDPVSRAGLDISCAHIAGGHLNVILGCFCSFMLLHGFKEGCEKVKQEALGLGGHAALECGGRGIPNQDRCCDYMDHEAICSTAP